MVGMREIIFILGVLLLFGGLIVANQSEEILDKWTYHEPVIIGYRQPYASQGYITAAAGGVIVLIIVIIALTVPEQKSR